jgi:8-oxo-dGTP pyrophosphatase MutT (NUDIX family)
VAEDVVRAAGGVILRSGGDGLREVLLVHRPGYDDWTFPKGKAARGEGDEDCALREVEEETGWRCELEAELPSTTYVDPKGRFKRVRYWLMRPVADPGAFAPNAEIDELRWTPLGEAAERLSYERDRGVLRAAVAPAST